MLFNQTLFTKKLKKFQQNKHSVQLKNIKKILIMKKNFYKNYHLFKKLQKKKLK